MVLGRITLSCRTVSITKSDFRRGTARSALPPLILLLGVQVLLLEEAGRISARAHPHAFVIQVLLTFVPYLLSAVVLRGAAPLRLPVVFGGAFILRLTALGGVFDLSDDLYRYLWEGHVGLSGFSPLLLAPGSPALAPLRDAIFSKVNHPHISSVYPPAAQVLFMGMAALHYDPLTPRLTACAFDLLTLFFLSRLIGQNGRPDFRLLLYAWNPLPIIEFAGSGHLDSIAIALMLAALSFRSPSRRASLGQAVVLSLSVLVKLLPIALLPALAREKWKTQGAGHALVFAGSILVMCTLAWFPMLGVPPSIPRGFLIYAENWSFNGPVFRLLTLALSGFHARLLIAFLYILLALLSARRYSPIQAAFALTSGFFLLSPTAHPWYLCWSLPFIAIYPRPSLIALSAAVFLSYLVFAGSSGWDEAWWLIWLVYVPPALVLIGEGVHTRRFPTRFPGGGQGTDAGG